MSNNAQSNNLQSLDELKHILKMNNDKQSIQVIAGDTARNILQSINNVAEKIEKSKQLVEDAKHAKGGLFGWGKTARRTELNTKAISQQNEAVVEMNALVQESIKLTCCSIFFAKNMVETIVIMMKEGFTTSDGRHIELSEIAIKQSEFIVQHAKNFVEHQAEYEERQEKQEQEIGQNRENISQNRENILINQQTINQNKESIAKNAEAIEHLKSKNSSQSLVISIIALAISIVSLALHFIN